ncbi:signal peptide peptidase SppA [Syntrophomonas wolfei]|jgi:protease-4|uniref:signal peptide peptidase SppA n=1 Tax=Syntrophomonas wolfei TaxID=863 RepID=UPI0023F32464|nr:signal peptide peptidase SppA [Syntrophomonas wolfei]
MHKKLVVFLLLAFLLLMAGLSIRAVNRLDHDSTREGTATIAVVQINGPIGGVSSWMENSSSTAGDIMEAIRKAGKREDIKAVVVRIDSPGGSAGASQEIAMELERLREKGKPVVTSMGDVCASGGYWIACSTDHIVANGASMTGSIGVIMQLSNLEGLYGKLGIRNQTIKSGEHKDMGSTSRELSAEEEKILQALVDDSYQQFLEQVQKGRQEKIAADKLLEIADGRIFTGKQALELGLVDSLGNYYDAVQQAEKMAGIKGESKLEVINAFSWWDRFKLGMFNPNLFQQGGFAELKY